MRPTTRAAGPALCFALATLTGCFSLARPTPLLERYVLGGAAGPGTDAGDGEGLTVGLRRLDLAPYLGTPAIVLRRGAHQIVLSDLHRWGEDPALSINHAVARYLGAEDGVGAAHVAPWPADSRHEYLVQLHVTRFEGVAAAEPSPGEEGEAHLQASWEIIRESDGVIVARGTTDHREAGWTVGDYAALVAMLDRGLVVLARDVAAGLGEAASTRHVRGRPLAGEPILAREDAP